MEPVCSSPGQGGERCWHAGDALLPLASGWCRARKPPSTRDLFTAHPVPLSGSTSPGFRKPPPRCGREATAPRRPRSRRHGIVSKTHQPKPRRTFIGRRNDSSAVQRGFGCLPIERDSRDPPTASRDGYLMPPSSASAVNGRLAAPRSAWRFFGDACEPAHICQRPTKL